jgi:uncharacterized membrane protein
MKKSGILFIFLLISFPSGACITCSRSLQQAIADSTDMLLLFKILLPFIVLGAIIAWLYHRAIIKNRRIGPAFPYTSAFIVSGIGLGGFIDGIVLHQILQWHEMLSHKIPPLTLIAKSLNMFWDGIFHLFTLAVTFTGLLMVFKLIKRKEEAVNNQSFAGGLLFGWGMFNVLEGLLNHHLFQLHHVNDFSPHYQLWDILFLMVSIVMSSIGWLLIKKAKIIKATR